MIRTNIFKRRLIEVSYTKKLAFAFLLIIVFLIVKETLSVLLMILAGTIIALYFHGLADAIHKRTRLPKLWSMVLSIIVTFLIISAIGWIVGSKLQTQIADLTVQLPDMINEAKVFLSQYSLGRSVIDEVSSEKLNNALQRFFNTTFGKLGDLYVIFFLTIFFTSNPSLYVNGIVAIVPPRHKDEAHSVLNRLGISLRRWFKARLIAMGAVALMTFIGLSIMGVPMAMALSVIAGVLTFIPNFGPALAIIPAVLIGFTISGNTAIMVAILYLVVQFIESVYITPKLQFDMVSLPPAFIIIGQLVMGAVAGYLGVILAMPVVLIILVLVNQLYVKKQALNG